MGDNSKRDVLTVGERERCEGRKVSAVQMLTGDTSELALDSPMCNDNFRDGLATIRMMVSGALAWADGGAVARSV